MENITTIFFTITMVIFIFGFVISYNKPFKNKLIIWLIIYSLAMILRICSSNIEILKIIKPQYFKKFEIIKIDNKAYAVLYLFDNLESFLTVESVIEDKTLKLNFKKPRLIKMYNTPISYLEFSKVITGGKK